MVLFSKKNCHREREGLSAGRCLSADQLTYVYIFMEQGERRTLSRWLA